MLHALSLALAWLKVGDVGGVLKLDLIGSVKIGIGAFETIDATSEIGTGQRVPARQVSLRLVFSHRSSPNVLTRMPGCGCGTLVTTN